MYDISHKHEDDFIDFSRNVDLRSGRTWIYSLLSSCRNCNVYNVSATTVVSYLLALFSLTIVLMTGQSGLLLFITIAALSGVVFLIIGMDIFKSKQIGENCSHSHHLFR